MLTKNDCLTLLYELKENGENVKEVTDKLIKSPQIDYDVLKFINERRTFDILDFYENLRRNYNNKKSKLYKEIVTIDDKEPRDCLVTLSSLLTQIFLYSTKVEDREMFLSHARANEIIKAFQQYFKTYDLSLCLKLLHLIRADLKVFENLKKEL